MVKTAGVYVVNTRRGRNRHEDIEQLVGENKMERGDAVSVLVQSIQKAHEKVTPLPPNCSIFRVPEPMRMRKPEAYTPHLVSIGPFHHNKKHLKPMEELKLQYLYDLLGRESPANLGESVEEKLGKCVETIMELESEARGCYSKIILPNDEFVKMMVIDGCFIIEFILKTNFREPNKLNAAWMSDVFKRDLLLLENQLPFLVLESLYNLLTGNSHYIDGQGPYTFSYRACRFLGGMLPPIESIDYSESSNFQVPQIFNDFLQGIRSWAKKDEADEADEAEEVDEEAPLLMEEEPEILEVQPENFIRAMHLLDFKRTLLLPAKMEEESRGVFVFTRTATELKEANVKFETGPAMKRLLDITFTYKSGVLSIPSMIIEDNTESLLRNLIAFEQSYEPHDQDITYYASFLDSLIDTPSDVELLQKKGIIDNLLGEPQEVADLFNGLLKEVIILKYNRNYLFNVCDDLKKYYTIPMNEWKASLVHNYCNSPWALISFLAAIFLLILTVIQTVCSIQQSLVPG
ncbi:hypothetical protein NE237_025935 [Protea cynaroides]|uniref:Uncharacterized protein n=1 Tax=Protea cynaroides TaxID=273540 RepID=A0A9Q0H7Z4_9MAGN|nr:hypothetical protein NE237_025935 [Protea cynaroides]